MEAQQLSQVIETLEGITGYPVFRTDITKDEVEANASFFIIEPDGDIANSENHFTRECVISFITKENAKVDPFALILKLEPAGLIFQRTETDYGRIANTEKEIKMLTFYFNQPLIVSYMDYGDDEDG